MHSFKELKFWQKSRILVKEVYILTEKLPKEEDYSLTKQIRRCAISVPSNIAEGCGRGTDAQLLHFLNIAQGSACELECQLILAFDLNFISNNELKYSVEKINEVQKMIVGFKKAVGKNSSKV